jgi:hypothetical protein
MREEHDNFERAEALVSRQLRALPLRRAPATLAARVLAAIAAGELQPVAVRENLPWYRHSFRHWPLPVQIAFALLSAALAHALVRLLGGVSSYAPAQLAGDELRSSWSVVQAMATIGQSLTDSLRALLASLPRNWLLFVVSGAVTSYTVLASAIAVVFRTIHR